MSFDDRGDLRDPATTRLLTWIDSVRQDVAFGLRLLRRSPIIGIASVLSLALAVGACLAVANIVDAVFLRKLPVRNSESLFQVVRNDLHSTGEVFSYPVFSTLRDHSRATADLFLATFVRIGWVRWDGGDGSEERVEFQYISGNFFEALGAGATLGRVLTKNDDKIPGAHPVAVISENYWARRFGRSRG
ncbi:MAG: ABC transporter permease, partial [Bryobacterales bacterium]|nr:ABC transporter permease [Bryobacterales bacterium]